MTDIKETSATNLQQAQVELEKTQLDIENLKLEIASKKRLAGIDLALQLLQTGTVIIGVVSLAFSFWQYRSEQNQHQREISDAAQREFMKPLLEKQQSLFVEASATAATIASTNDREERRKAVNTFWKLYWGPLVMVESPEVSGAMKKFGHCLDNTARCDAAELQSRSLSLASTLEDSMLKTWNKKPEEFMHGQFDYRRSN